MTKCRKMSENIQKLSDNCPKPLVGTILGDILAYLVVLSGSNLVERMPVTTQKRQTAPFHRPALGSQHPSPDSRGRKP